MRHDRWLDLAIKAALNSTYPQWRLGACLVRGGSVLSIGWNSIQNDPALIDEADIRRGLASTHAEIDAINHAADPRGATLYVARITPGGSIGRARPCLNCLTNIRKSDIKSVWWTEALGLKGNIKL
jgi:deoxycytidylate deaminase